MRISFQAVRKTTVRGPRRLLVPFLVALGLGCSSLSLRMDGAAVMKENLLTVRVNGVEVSDGETVLELEPGRLYVPSGVFYKGRLRRPPQLKPTHVPALGVDYYPLDAIPGLHYAIDQETQTLDITVPSAAFGNTTLDGVNNLNTTATPPDPGLFLNHDFEMLYSGGKKTLSGLVEGGFFSRLGVLTTEYAAPNLTQSFAPVRLTTQFFRDFQNSKTTLVIGDSFSAVSPWALTVAYAGVSYGSKFATQPGFLPTPLPVISGMASQPSTVDVYIDGVKRMSQPVAPGPFAIQNIPVITGQGQISMVVTDILGRQQVITESYIRASTLLRAGVSDFTYQAGAIRLNYGTRSNDYGSAFAAGTHRLGITDYLTLEGRAEVQPYVETVGLGAVYAVHGVGIVSGGGAASMDHDRSGGLYYAQFSRTQRSFGFAAQVQQTTVDFRQLGLLDFQRAPKTLLQGQISKPLGAGINVAVGLLERVARTEQDAKVATASLNVRLHRASLMVGGTYSLIAPRQYGLNVALVVPLGERTVAIASADSSPATTTGSLEVDRSIPLGPGYGYRLRTTEGDQEKQEGGFYYQNNDGYYGVEASQQTGQNSLRLMERGSVVFLHKHLLVSRWLTDSFGVVEVPNAKNIPVYVNNQVLATTDSRGLALLPWLVQYSRNSVRLDDANLPTDVSVDLEERTVVPMARSPIFLQYKPETIGGATLLLVTADGKPVPQGAMVTVNGNSEAYEVELRGEVFAIDIDYPAVVHAAWDGGACDVRIAKPPADTPVPRIGPLTCVGGK
jgi:outer membrane usher protein